MSQENARFEYTELLYLTLLVFDYVVFDYDVKRLYPCRVILGYLGFPPENREFVPNRARLEGVT